MAGWIPDEKLSEIRNASDIVEVISESVLLKRAGRNYVGLCPFHSEKTPSFTVSPEKQIFYCFGCGAGGNVFNFLMKHQGISFFEATRTLAQRYGVSLPEKTSASKRQGQRTPRERILEINRLAMEYYHRILLKDPKGEAAKSYLHGRGITDTVIEAFSLGYAPKGWDALALWLERKQIPRRAAFRSGLVIPRRKGGGGYDRFRDRIVFPIRDLSGQVVGFGGRVLDESLPKYINSPETPAFQKGRILFGLDRARKACRQRDSVMIVEGYFDVISLHQKGLQNAVAPLGTGVTDDHIRLLRGFARTFYLVFDPDAAGLRAMERIVPTLIRENVAARVVTLPEGKDPDTFVREKGAEAFSGLITHALPVMTFLIESAKRRHGLTPSGKSRIVSDLENVLASIDDPVNRSIFVKDVAEQVGIPEQALLERIRRARERGGPGRHRQRTTGKETHFQDAGQSAPALRLERKILSMMLQYPVMIEEIRKRGIVGRFTDPTLKAIGHWILEAEGTWEALIPELISRAKDTDTGETIAQLAAGEDSWNTEGCLKLIRQFEIHLERTERAALNTRIQAAQKEDDPVLLAALLKEKQRMIHRYTHPPREVMENAEKTEYSQKESERDS